MGRFYVYDMSEYMGFEPEWELPADGLYECNDFKIYWRTPETYPFIIRYKNELAGFAIINKKGSDKNIDFNMAEFFIARKFKGKGVGKYVAHQCFQQFPGKWEVMLYPENKGAYLFWKKTIYDYTNNDFEEYSLNILHFDNAIKAILRFNSLRI